VAQSVPGLRSGVVRTVVASLGNPPAAAGMTQPTLPNRKPPVFVRCPVCGAEFRNFSGQRWCSVDCAGVARCRVGRAPPKRQIAKDRP
jgi:hypothetical protein